MYSTGSSARAVNLSERRRVLGARHLVFFVVAAAAPLAFSLGAIPLAIGRGGIGTVAAFVVTGVILMIFAVGYLAMAGHLRRAGGLNEFVSAGLGRVPGVGAAFVAVTAYACAATGAVGVFAVFANVAADDLLGIEVPWPVWAVVGTVLMGVLGLLQVEANARVLGVIICLEIGILLVVAFAIVIEGGAHGLSAEALAPSSIFVGHPGAMFAVTISAFAGFEATVIYSDEVKDRTRTLRRATLSVIVVMALLYGFVTWALIQAYGNTEAADIANFDPTTMFLSATETYVGTWAVRTLEILVVASWFASMVAFHNATARYLSTMGKDRIVPLRLATIHSRFGSPWRASLTHTVFTLAVVGVFAMLHADPYLDLYILGSSPAVVGIPVLEVLASVAIIAYFRRDRRGHSRMEVLVAPAIATITLTAIVIWIVTQIDLFTARPGILDIAIPCVIGAVFVAGMLRARLMSRTAPTAFTHTLDTTP